jgi:flagellar biogenesis protein FliO
MRLEQSAISTVNEINDCDECTISRNGLGAWLIWQARARLRARKTEPSRLTVLERVALAPRQSLALVEADGERLLVATTADSAPAFYSLAGAKCSVRAELTPARRAVERRGAARRRMW